MLQNSLLSRSFPSLASQSLLWINTDLHDKCLLLLGKLLIRLIQIICMFRYIQEASIYIAKNDSQRYRNHIQEIIIRAIVQCMIYI